MSALNSPSICSNGNRARGTFDAAEKLIEPIALEALQGERASGSFGSLVLVPIDRGRIVHPRGPRIASGTMSSSKSKESSPVRAPARSTSAARSGPGAPARTDCGRRSSRAQPVRDLLGTEIDDKSWPSSHAASSGLQGIPARTGREGECRFRAILRRTSIAPRLA